MAHNSENQILLIFLARITFLSLAEKLKLFKKLDNSDSLALLSIEDLRNITGRPLSRVLWDASENLRHAKQELVIIQAKKIKIVPYFSAEYPALLRESVNPPFALFCIGNIACLSEKTVSVVGSRHTVPEASRAAFNFAYDAANAGVTVISGLAFGLDAASHAGAVEANFKKQNDCTLGKTCAVLPCGIDTIVPSANKKLAENIIATGGAIISEYVPGISSEKWRFVQRNRIVAALSPATLVVYAPSGSGALITANMALEAGRDVLFHKAAFCEGAKMQRNLLDENLKKKIQKGNAASSKIENTPEKYLEAGAPVIESYQDYCRCMAEMPGTRRYLEKNVQFELFENKDFQSYV